MGKGHRLSIESKVGTSAKMNGLLTSNAATQNAERAGLGFVIVPSRGKRGANLVLLSLGL
jgi:hypothetical protein